MGSRALSGRRPSDFRCWRTDAGMQPGHPRTSAPTPRLVPVPRPWPPPAAAWRSGSRPAVPNLTYQDVGFMKNRLAEPFGPTNGALGREIIAIGQTEINV